MLPPTTYIPATDVPECAPGLIHSMPYCLTPEQFEAMWNPPVPVELVGEPLARALVTKYFPAWEVEDAMRVVGCETGWTFSPDAWNSRSGASGYFQHMPRYWAARSAAAGWAGHSIFEPEANVAVAAWLWGQTGTWRHWSCKP